MIDYGLIDKSIKFYEEECFQRIETPWLVSEAIQNASRPPEATEYKVEYGNRSKRFVASGEQSFLYLINKGYLPYGTFQTVTPCMRREDFDLTHTKYFVKNELIMYKENIEIPDAHWIATKAMIFFRSVVPEGTSNLLKYKQKGNGSIDIEYDGIELGSYGTRQFGPYKWAYGTGLAEPRFSTVMKTK